MQVRDDGSGIQYAVLLKTYWIQAPGSSPDKLGRGDGVVLLYPVISSC